MNPLQQLLLAGSLGLLVGLQREWAKGSFAGIRTFPLITVFGALSALLAEQFGGWTVAAALVSLAGMIVIGNVIKLQKGDVDPGLTTEMAMLVMFGVGAAVVLGYATLAIATGGSVAVLLHWKQPLHQLVGRIGADDFRAIIRLVLIAVVILPILPNRTYGPYDVLNPFEIWLMVVLIVGISMGAYVVQRALGSQMGSLLAGVLGGLISSTAATIGYARETHKHRERSDIIGAIIMVASTIVFVRVLAEIAIVAPTVWGRFAPPLLGMMTLMTVISIAAYVIGRKSIAEPLATQPPSDLKAPIAFGLMYAIVLFLVAAAKQHLGNSGMFAVAALSGLTDMDALTLSTAQLVRAERVDVEVGWRLVLVAAMANIVFKGVAVAALGHRRLTGRIGIWYGASLLGGVGILWLW